MLDVHHAPGKGANSPPYVAPNLRRSDEDHELEVRKRWALVSEAVHEAVLDLAGIRERQLMQALPYECGRKGKDAS